MRRTILGVGLALWPLLASPPVSAEAKQRQTFGMCAHPHGATVNEWSYQYNSLSLVTGIELQGALEAHPELARFFYDPNGPVDNLRLVPLHYPNRPTKCEPKPPPKNPPPPSPPPKEEDEDPPAKERKGNGNGSGKTGNGKGGGGDGDAPPSEKTGDGRPPGVKDFVGEKPLTEEEKHFLRKQKLREACLRDPNDCDDPLLVGEPLLKQENLLPYEGVLKQERLLPTPEEMRAQAERRCKEPGKECKDGDGKTPKKDSLDELAILAAILNGQMNEDLKRADGKDHGIIGGQDPDGFDNPVAQVLTSVVSIAAAIHTQARAFVNKLRDAAARKTAFVIKPDELSEEAAEFLASTNQAFAITDTMHKLGVIGPYRVMQKFTAKLGGAYQAHHILEKAKLRFLKGKLDPDLIPSVILTDAEHKAITDELAIHTKGATTLKELWAGYQKAYANRPEWLKAIEQYFKKAK